MVNYLADISSYSAATLLAINAGELQTTVNESTGAILPALAAGTLDVPKDMIANIHQGEAVVPSSMAEGIRNGDLTLGNVDNSDVVAAIKELTVVLAVSQEDIVDATNRNNRIASNFGSMQPINTAGVA